MTRSLITFNLCILILTLASASQVVFAGPIEDQLQAAKEEYEKVVDEARGDLITALEAEVKRVAETGNLDATLALKKDLEEFKVSGKLPSSSRVKTPVSSYRSTMDKARKKLIESHRNAVADYTKALDLDKAQSIKQQLQQLEAGDSRTALPDESGIPAGADTIPAIRQFLEAKRAAQSALLQQRERVTLVLEQRIGELEQKNNSAEAASKLKALRSARDQFDSYGTIPDLAEVQNVVRQTRSSVDAATTKADKAAERAIEVAKTRKSEELASWLTSQRASLGVFFDWRSEKGHVTYEHIQPNFSRAGYAPYIDAPPTRLLDGELKEGSGRVGWQGVKPNLIQFTFDHDVHPKFIRMYFVGNESNGETNIPKSVTIYDAVDPKARRKLGALNTDKKTSMWLEVPLSGNSRTFVLDIEKTPVWTLLAEVEFK